MNVTSSQNDHSLIDIEGKLQSSLRPIAPRVEFRGKLRDRLLDPTTPTLETDNGAIGLIVIALGLLAGITILLLGKRAILILGVGFGLIASRWVKKK
jgi:hypothetical protein